MKKLILVRHGETTMNLQKLYYGFLDADLTEKGIEQVKSAREILKDMDYDEIYSSDLKRAYKTAEIINHKGLEIKVSKEIRELNFGIFEGYTYQELKEKYPEELLISQKEWKTYNFENGESPSDLQKRVVNFVESLEDNKTYLIGAHWGVICTMLSYYFANKTLDSYWKYKIENGSVTIIEFKDNYPLLCGLNWKGV